MVALALSYCAETSHLRGIKFGGCILLAALTFAMAAASRTEAAIAGLENVADSLSLPVYATHAPGDPDRLFIVEKGGLIKILNLAAEEVNSQEFLQVSDTDPAGEGGLLGLAFHPEYQTNGKFYTYVTIDNGGASIDGETSPFNSHVREYTVSASPDIANPTPKEIISWVQPRANHNGGWIGFSPVDDYLYITSGDGGKQGDPDNNAQTLDESNPGQSFPGEPLGKVLRLDVNADSFPADPDRNYAVPASNPFVDDPSANDEIWAYGLRNPWRASFDRQTGDFWIGDVGQNTREEINHQLASSTGGENYAWQRREGLIAHQGGALLPGDEQPVYDYSHGGEALQGNSVVGGVVYRGPDPTLQGTYFFADTVSTHFWTLDSQNPVPPEANIDSELGTVVGSPVAFGEDLLGNLYVVDHEDGNVFRILTDTLVTGDFNATGLVNEDDLVNWQAGFGTDFGATFSDGDADGDMGVDGLDFLRWQQFFGATSQSAPLSARTIPEPTGVVLTMLGLATLSGRRSNRSCGWVI